VSWKTVIEIGNDKKIKKMILQEGEGYNRPNDCATVKGIFYCSLYIDGIISEWYSCPVVCK
jgi:hypothetical protein